MDLEATARFHMLRIPRSATGTSVSRGLAVVELLDLEGDEVALR